MIMATSMLERYPDELVKPKRGRPKSPEYLYMPTKEERERFGLHFVEMQAIDAALKYSDGSITKTARILGIQRRTLQRKLGRK